MTIKAKVSSVTLKCKIKVKEAYFSDTSLSIEAGKTKTLTLYCANKGTVRWKSSDKSIVKFDSGSANKVVLRGLKEGKATITANYLDKNYTCTVKVKAAAVTPTPTPTPAPEKMDYKTAFQAIKKYVTANGITGASGSDPYYRVSELKKMTSYTYQSNVMYIPGTNLVVLYLNALKNELDKAHVVALYFSETQNATAALIYQYSNAVVTDGKTSLDMVIDAQGLVSPASYTATTQCQLKVDTNKTSYTIAQIGQTANSLLHYGFNQFWSGMLAKMGVTYADLGFTQLTSSSTKGIFEYPLVGSAEAMQLALDLVPGAVVEKAAHVGVR